MSVSDLLLGHVRLPKIPFFVEHGEPQKPAALIARQMETIKYLHPPAGAPHDTVPLKA
jgi:hypothetical protein